MLADAVCRCASGRWYFLFLDSLYFEATVNSPASLYGSLNSMRTSVRISRRNGEIRKRLEEKIKYNDKEATEAWMRV